MAAAYRILEEKLDFTTKEVASEADVALRTFYHHFPSKDDLLIALLGDMIRRYVADLEPRAVQKSEPIERLQFIVTAPFRILPQASAAAGPAFITSQHWRLQQVDPVGVARAIAPYRELIQTAIEDGEDAGVLTPRDAVRDAWLITQLVLAVYHHQAFASEPSDPASAARTVWSFCADSLGVRPRRRATPLVAVRK